VVGSAEVVEILLENGANPLKADLSGETPLDVADADVVELLKKRVQQ
jgi:ankyrin repeat protein